MTGEGKDGIPVLRKGLILVVGLVVVPLSLIVLGALAYLLTGMGRRSPVQGGQPFIPGGSGR